MEINWTLIWRYVTIATGVFGTIGAVVSGSLHILLMGIIFSFICHNMAGKRDKDQKWAAVYGYVWGIWALFHYMAQDKVEGE